MHTNGVLIKTNARCVGNCAGYGLQQRTLRGDSDKPKGTCHSYRHTWRKGALVTTVVLSDSGEELDSRRNPVAVAYAAPAVPTWA